MLLVYRRDREGRESPLVESFSWEAGRMESHWSRGGDEVEEEVVKAARSSEGEWERGLAGQFSRAQYHCSWEHADLLWRVAER